MADLLFEIGTEELPSWYVKSGGEALVVLLTQRLAAAELAPTGASGYATPRRLAVWARGLPASTPKRTVERRGPPASVAFDESGAPTKAALAFAAKNGVDQGALELRKDEKGEYVYAHVTVGGEAAAAVLPELLAGVVKDLPAPRKMRWGDEPTPFIRPVAWLLALLGDEVIPVAAAGVRAGAITRGHRFMAEGEFGVKSAADYAPALAERFVIADRAARREATWLAVQAAADEQGLSVTEDDALLDEVTDLVESPFAVLGSFASGYLQLPEEVLATVMIKHQRFFPTRDASGRLAAAFVGVSNTSVPDVAVVRQGYEQVLAGRLYDARFFWTSDRRKSLSQHAWGLSGIAFQQELGSMADKTARVGETVGQLLDALDLEQKEAYAATQALPIFRADLATEMIFEFPELEGVMARAYALAEGLPAATAEALLGGVSPRTHEDDVPATAAGAVLALADRVDKLIGFFALGKRPSGSADPFALRRDGLAVARVLNARGWPLRLTTLVEAGSAAYAAGPVTASTDVQQAVVEFVWDRVASLLLDNGAPVNVVRAAIQGSVTVIGAARRVELLKALMDLEEMPALMALYKRAANLAKGEAVPVDAHAFDHPEHKLGAAVKPALFTEPQEAPLLAALPAAQRGADELLAAAKGQLPGWDLRDPAPRQLTGVADALQALIGIKAPLDEFLDGVLVMADDPDVRRNRLALLSEVVRLLRQLGDLEQLAGA